MVKCSFCGSILEMGTGKMIVKPTGKITWLCSKKCEKNFAMGREAKNMKWITKAEKK